MSNVDKKKDSTPRLYGIESSNRSGHDLWGKNQFNSTFPISLACYMRDQNILPVYLSLAVEKGKITLSNNDNSLTVDELFNCSKNSNIHFDFESSFEPYKNYLAIGKLGHIDVIVKNKVTNDYLRPLEVKLTVVPDNTTCELAREKWAPEMVIRPDATSHAVMSIYHSLKSRKTDALRLLKPVASRIQEWNNSEEIRRNSGEIIDTLKKFLTQFIAFQKPFILNPIWVTQGQSPMLDPKHAFDIFVWSDMALCFLFIDMAEGKLIPVIKNNKKRLEWPDTPISRQMRAAVRMLRALYSLFSMNQFNYDEIYKNIELGKQTDKEFSVPGSQMKKYITHNRLIEPILPSKILRSLIQNGGEKELMPERRFDATIYFTAAHLFEEAEES